MAFLKSVCSTEKDELLAKTQSIKKIKLLPKENLYQECNQIKKLNPKMVQGSENLKEKTDHKVLKNILWIYKK